ncbi:MAG: ATP synthase subunit I [Arenicellales bacterium]|jgi:F1F0 ATPase subunit 2
MVTIVSALAGLALGGVYFYLLHRNVQRQVAAASPTVFMLHTVARLALAVAVFWWIAQQGALPLLAALAGFIAVRFAMVRILGTV